MPRRKFYKKTKTDFERRRYSFYVSKHYPEVAGIIQRYQLEKPRQFSDFICNQIQRNHNFTVRELYQS